MYESKHRKFFILDQISIEDIDYRYTDGFLRCRGKEYLLILIEVLDMMSASKKIFWDHFSKSLVTIQVFTSETWAPTRLKNGGKCDCLCDCDL